MKRDLRLLLDDGNRTDTTRRKRNRACWAMRPSFYEMKNASVLCDSIIAIIQFILNKQVMSEDLIQTDPSGPGSFIDFQFLFFLDGQGKENVDVICEMLPRFSSITAVFISSNLKYASQNQRTGLFAFSGDQECKTLSREMGLLSPLGGGHYPINYLVIVDSHMIVRYRTPLRFSYCYSAYQKFGLTLAQLEGLLEEYSTFAGLQRMER